MAAAIIEHPCDDVAMRRRGNGFKQYWHDRSLELEDGDTLRWLVIDEPGSDAWIACFRRDGRGGVHHSEGHRLLAEHAHPDAALPTMTDTPSAPLTH